MAHDDDASASAAYLEWKGWGIEQPFGSLSNGDTAYFTKELREATRNSPIQDVLEIGFGNGTFLAFCRSRGWKVTGTELGAESIAAGKAAGYDVHPADYLTDIPEESFDLIVAFDLLEHIPQDEIVGFLTALSARLRKGGTLVLRFPNADSWLGNSMQHGDPTHVTAVGYLKMKYFALRANLDVVAFRGATRRGFATSFVHGLYSVTAGPIVDAAAFAKRMLYFPGLPLVLSTPNVVCVARRRN